MSKETQSSTDTTHEGETRVQHIFSELGTFRHLFYELFVSSKLKTVYLALL